MGYAHYEIGGVQRGYGVPDVCNHPECSAEIDRGLSYLCYGCTGYFCGAHLGYWAEADLDCFAGDGRQCCAACAKNSATSEEDGG